MKIHRQGMYSRDVAIDYEFTDAKNQSQACRSCTHHAYVSSKSIRVCNKHDLIENEMQICDDYRSRDPKSELNKLFKGS